VTKNVTPRQRKAVESLLTTGDKSQAAELAGVKRQTIYKWLKQPEFQQALREAEAEALKGLSQALARLGSKAADTLDKSMDTDSDRVRVRAADIVLQRLLQLRELIDLDARVRELEKSQ
jgi:hypothetical protein